MIENCGRFLTPGHLITAGAARYFSGTTFALDVRLTCSEPEA